MTLKQQIDEAKRELAMRERLYPQWIDAGKIEPASASSRLEAMRAIVRTLEGLQEERQQELFAKHYGD